MKTLLLIRHAKSSWKDLNLNDFDRTLNTRGKADAPFMGKLLKEAGETPDLIVSSPAKRALATAKLIARELGYKTTGIQQNHMIYDATFQDLLELVYKLDDTHGVVAIVGHNPGLTLLSDYLTDYYIDNIPTCGIVKMVFDTSRWKEIIKGAGSMEYFKYPRKYDSN